MHVLRLKAREPEPPHVVESNEMEGHKEEHELVTGDDCEAVVDDSDNELVEEIEEYDVENEEVGSVGIEEEICKVLSTHFGDIARNDERNDDESQDNDCWKENIFYPLSSVDAEEDAQREAHEDEASSDKNLALGMHFLLLVSSNKLLWYSLKKIYSIELYISTHLKRGAVLLRY